MNLYWKVEEDPNKFDPKTGKPVERKLVYKVMHRYPQGFDIPIVYLGESEKHFAYLFAGATETLEVLQKIINETAPMNSDQESLWERARLAISISTGGEIPDIAKASGDK